MKTFIKLGIGLVLSLFIDACKPDISHDTGNLKLRFENRANNTQLELGKTYNLPNGQQIALNTFSYYISNIVLLKADGTNYTVPQDSSYFLIKADAPESQVITLRHIPAGDYSGIRFTLGVDSLRSVADISKRTGVLDPAVAGDLYWGWNTGYVFMKIEGSSPQAPYDEDTQSNLVLYAIGGYGGFSEPTPNNLKTISLDTPEALQIRQGQQPELSCYADALQVFHSPNTIDFTRDQTVVHWGEIHSLLANNYLDMFSIHQVKSN